MLGLGHGALDEIKDCGAVEEIMEDQVAIAEPAALGATRPELVLWSPLEDLLGHEAMVDQKHEQPSCKSCSSHCHFVRSCSSQCCLGKHCSGCHMRPEHAGYSMATTGSTVDGGMISGTIGLGTTGLDLIAPQLWIHHDHQGEVGGTEGQAELETTNAEQEDLVTTMTQQAMQVTMVDQANIETTIVQEQPCVRAGRKFKESLLSCNRADRSFRCGRCPCLTAYQNSWPESDSSPCFFIFYFFIFILSITH